MSTDETKIDKTKKAVEKRVGFDAKGKPYPGVDKKSGERMALVFDALIAEFGFKEADAKYIAIANLEGEMVHPTTREPYMWRYFFDPRAEGPGYRPDLAIATLPEEARGRVSVILNTPQLEES